MGKHSWVSGLLARGMDAARRRAAPGAEVVEIGIPAEVRAGLMAQATALGLPSSAYVLAVLTAPAAQPASAVLGGGAGVDQAHQRAAAQRAALVVLADAMAGAAPVIGTTAAVRGEA